MSEDHSAQQREYEDRVRHRVKILRRVLVQGRLHLPADDEQIRKDLQAVRFGADGEPILSTVSGTVRVLAMAAEELEARREALEVDLEWILTHYFGLVESAFEDVTKVAAQYPDAPPWALAQALVKRPGFVEHLAPQMEGVIKAFDEFWKQYGYAVTVHLEETKATKGVYGGDIFPSIESGTVQQAALFADCVVVPDPIHRVGTQLGSAMRDAEIVSQFIRRSLEVLRLKELAFADTAFPILTIVPAELPGFTPEFYGETMREDGLVHLNAAIGSSFESIEEAHAWLEQVQAAEDIEKRCADPSRLLFDHDFDGRLAARFARQKDMYTSRLNTKSRSLADSIVMDAMGRMGQAGVLLHRARSISGQPLLDAPTSWRYLEWKTQYDELRSANQEAISGDIATLNALVQSTEVAGLGLGGLTVEAVTRLRQSGSLEQLRAELRQEIEASLGTTEADRKATAAAVVKRFRQSIEKAQEELAKLEADRNRLYAIRLPSTVANVGLGILGAATGNYWLTLGSAMAQAAGLPSGANLWTAGRQLHESGERLMRSPYGFLVSELRSS